MVAGAQGADRSTLATRSPLAVNETTTTVTAHHHDHHAAAHHDDDTASHHDDHHVAAHHDHHHAAAHHDHGHRTTTTGTLPLTTTTTGKTTKPTAPTTLPPPTPTTLPPPIPGSPPTTTTGQLNVNRPSGTPGSPVTAAGQGCDPGAAVLLTLGGQEVGQTTADPNGTFSVPLMVPNIAVGQYPVVAQCGPTLTTVLGVSLLANADPGSLAFVILIFFVLAGLLLLQLMLRRGKA